ncbi:MAG TPA: hypothetical protein VGE93_18410, partial [Bryobacteraceae bacterium]
IFSQKPYLACEVCNGALGMLEGEMKAFAPPLFSTSAAELTLTVDQQRTMAGWISLITVLAEHIDKSKSSLAIADRDVRYLRKHRVPPPEWSIVCASLEGREWFAKYRHRATFIGQFSSEAEYWATVRKGMTSNTQFSSFGIGKLFFQVFTCPNPRFVADYRRCAVDAELSQSGPIPRAIFRHRTLKLPTDLILTDESADILADAYDQRIRELSRIAV